MAQKLQRKRRKLRFIIDPVLISIPEFSRISGLGLSLTRELVEDGTLPSRTIKKRIWIVREPAVAWLRNQAEPRPAA